MLEDGCQVVEGIAGVEEPSAESALEADEDIAPVDDVSGAGVGVKGFAGGMNRQGVEVVAEDFCAEVLLGGEPGHAGKLFQGETMLDALEGFFDTPPCMIEGAEGGGGVSFLVEQGGDEGAHFVAKHLADQAHGGGRPGQFVIEGVLSVGRAQGDDLLGQAAPARFWFRLESQERRPLAVAALAGALAWLFGLAAQQFWKPLAEGTFWLSFHLLSLIYPDALYDLSNFGLGTPGFMVRISPQCSGYEGIGLVAVFLTLYLWLFRAEIRFPQALLLFPIGALAIWLANALRVTLLIALGTSYSKEVALGGFHSQAGWIAFIAIALGLIFAVRRLGLFAKTEATPMADQASLAPALLLPLMVLMAAIMLTSALSAGFDRFYPLRVVATAAALWYFRSVYLRWDWRPSWQAMVIGTVVFVLWLLLEPTADGSKSALGMTLAGMSPGEKTLWLAFRVVGSVLLVPLAEELAFRGYLLRRLAGREGDDLHPGRFAWLPFLVSSIAFGLLHSRWLAGTLAGMAYALAYYHRGRLADAVAAHMATNGLLALYVLAFGAWSPWS